MEPVISAMGDLEIGDSVVGDWVVEGLVVWVGSPGRRTGFFSVCCSGGHFFDSWFRPAMRASHQGYGNYSHGIVIISSLLQPAWLKRKKRALLLIEYWLYDAWHFVHCLERKKREFLHNLNYGLNDTSYSYMLLRSSVCTITRFETTVRCLLRTSTLLHISNSFTRFR